MAANSRNKRANDIMSQTAMTTVTAAVEGKQIKSVREFSKAAKGENTRERGRRRGWRRRRWRHAAFYRAIRRNLHFLNEGRKERRREGGLVDDDDALATATILFLVNTVQTDGHNTTVWGGNLLKMFC